jgi:hypothetical protein
MHKDGGCYGDNLECLCPFDRTAVITAIQQSGRSIDLLSIADQLDELAEA